MRGPNCGGCCVVGGRAVGRLQWLVGESGMITAAAMNSAAISRALQRTATVSAAPRLQPPERCWLRCRLACGWTLLAWPICQPSNCPLLSLRPSPDANMASNPQGQRGTMQPSLLTRSHSRPRSVKQGNLLVSPFCPWCVHPSSFHTGSEGAAPWHAPWQVCLPLVSIR